MSLYVYALVASPGDRLGEGLAGEPLFAVPLGGGELAAVVGEPPAALAPTAELLRGHDETVRRLHRALPALLPARFGVLAADAPALARLLEPRRAELLQSLATVRGREQMTLRLFSTHEASAGAESDLGDVGPGTRYLRRRPHLALPALGLLRSALASWVKDERVRPHQARPLVASVHHLIDVGQSAAYLAAVAASEPPAGLHVRASGPWPPYAFAPGG